MSHRAEEHKLAHAGGAALVLIATSGSISASSVFARANGVADHFASVPGVHGSRTAVYPRPMYRHFAAVAVRRPPPTHFASAYDTGVQRWD